MKDTLNFRRKPLALAVAIATGATPVLANAAAGRIEFAYGQVAIENASGTDESIRKGKKVNAGDTVVTERGRAQIRFTDGSFVSLQPKTSFKIDDYNYAGKEDGSERSVFSLFRGGLRTITGLIGRRNKSNYRLNTPVATIGIRGTAYRLLIQTDGSLILGCNFGGCSATNDGGSTSTDAPGVILVLNQFTQPTIVNGEAGESLLVLRPPSRMIDPLTEADEFIFDITDLDPQQICDLLIDAGFTFEEAQALVVQLFPDFVKLGAILDDGPGFAVAFTFDGGEGGAGHVADFEVPVTADFTEGELEGWASESANRGELTLVEAEADAIIGWGRWVDQTEGGEGVFDPPGATGADIFDGPEGHSLHYVIGRPTDLASLMTAPHNGRFKVLGFTTPTNTGGDLGTFNGGAFQVDFAANSVDGAVAFTFDNQYVLGFTSLGAPAGTFKATGPGPNLNGTVFGGGCCFSCEGKIAGLVAGPGAERAGFVYHVSDFSENEHMFGSVVFEQNPIGPTVQDFLGQFAGGEGF